MSVPNAQIDGAGFTAEPAGAPTPARCRSDCFTASEWADPMAGGAAAYAGLTMAIQIAIVGGSEATAPVMAVAEKVGAALASAGAIIVCGGLGGVMAAACRGAKSAGGLTVGFLPGRDPSAANPWVDVIIATGLGEARNSLVVGSAAVVIAIDGEYGTLSEIALALRSGIPVIGIGTWSLTRPDGQVDAGIVPMVDPYEAAEVALSLASARV